jgi:polyisoprenoid-binding protein YceI
MKKISLFLSIISLFGFLACGTNDSKTETSGQDTSKTTSNFSLDTQNSVLNWAGTMVGMYSHKGTLKFKEGKFELENGKVKSGSFTIDMMTMLTTDDDALYKMAPREKLIGHLQSDDFFSAATYPTSTFEITGLDGENIKGKLTIKGISNEETVTDVKISTSEGTTNASGKLVFDRQKYGITYKGKMKDMVLADNIELEISLVGKAL